MLDYQSDYLSIKYHEKEKLLLPVWSGKPLTAELFMAEMRNYMVLFHKTKAERAIWNHTNFTFTIPDNLFSWIETEVNQPAKKGGVQKVGFILGEDVMAQFSTMNSFESTKSVFAPRYFAHPAKALDWVNKKEEVSGNPFEQVIELLIDKNEEKGIASIQMEIKLEQLPYYMQKLNELFNHQAFVYKNYQKFMRLTAREKEILGMVTQGYTSQEISARLQISFNTILTHRRNILRKLECKNVADMMRFTTFIHL